MFTGHLPLKITLIGAGSVVFTRKLLGDILSRPELAGCHIALHDIDEHRLRLAEGLAQRVAAAVGVAPLITASTDRRRAIEGAQGQPGPCARFVARRFCSSSRRRRQ